MQERFLRDVFNCPAKHFDVQKDEAPLMEETDVETQSSGNELSFHATDSDPDDVFRATDDEEPKQNPSRSYAARRREPFTFLGKRVCSRAFARLLGVGQTTLQRLRNGEAMFTNKSRPPIPKHPSFGFSLRGDAGSKWSHVVLFLWMIYHSSAECMPTDFVSGFKNLQAGKKKDELDDCIFPESNDNEDDVLRSVNGFMRSLHQYNSDIEAHMIGPGFFRGERRHLAHGNMTEMFFEYRAYCKAVGESDPASFSTFNRIAQKVFGPHMSAGFLRFRKPSEHAVCDVCTRLKRSLRFRRGVLGGSDGSSADADAVSAYTSHILHQWLDRQCYWSLRTLSQGWFRRERELGEKRLG